MRKFKDKYETNIRTLTEIVERELSSCDYYAGELEQLLIMTEAPPI